MCSFPHSSMPHFGLYCRQKGCKMLDILKVLTVSEWLPFWCQYWSFWQSEHSPHRFDQAISCLCGAWLELYGEALHRNCLEVFGKSQEPWITNDWARIGARYWKKGRWRISGFHLSQYWNLHIISTGLKLCCPLKFNMSECPNHEIEKINCMPCIKTQENLKTRVLLGSSPDCWSVQTSFWISSVLWTEFLYGRTVAMVREEMVVLLTSNRKEESRFPKRKLWTKVSNLFHFFVIICKGPTWRIKKLVKAAMLTSK